MSSHHSFSSGWRKRLLCLLSRNFLRIFFPRLPGNFALKNGGNFWWIFSGLRFPGNEARRILEIFGESSEQNSGQNSGQKFEKFGELSFCNYSNLRKGGLSLREGSLHDGFGGFDGCGGSGDSVESTLPSSCWSYKIQDKEATVTVLMVLAVVTATPLKLNPPFPSSW